MYHYMEIWQKWSAPSNRGARDDDDIGCVVVQVILLILHSTCPKSYTGTRNPGGKVVSGRAFQWKSQYSFPYVVCLVYQPLSPDLISQVAGAQCVVVQPSAKDSGTFWYHHRRILTDSKACRPLVNRYSHAQIQPLSCRFQNWSQNFLGFSIDAIFCHERLA